MSPVSRWWPQGVLRIVFASDVIGAAVTGVMLLASPGSTARTFSWGLGPEPLTSVVAGLYLASAVTFAFALRLPWPRTRGLALGVLGWTVPTLIVTLVHLDQFDFGRFQAVAWMLLFSGTPLLMTAIVVAHEQHRPRGSEPDRAESRLPAWVRVGLALVAVAGLAWAVALWVDPRGAFGELLPFELPPLGGRFLGCWAFLVAVMAAYAFGRNRWSEAQVSLVAVAALFLGALVGALRSFTESAPAGRATYVSVLALLLTFSFALLAGAWMQERGRTRPSGSSLSSATEP